MEEQKKDIPPNVFKPIPKPLKPGQAYKPSPGYAYNPALTWGRNKPCLCKSGKKFKRCCLYKIARVILLTEAKKIDKYMKEYNKILDA